MDEKDLKTVETCRKQIPAVHDALDILNGRWKITIITSLFFSKMRFTDLLREVNGISGKMLSRELKDLEINQLIKRTVLDIQPIGVEYELTDYGRTLEKVVIALSEWGLDHRKKIIGK
ncbi:DNA-binding HxlR family transcriptional regulator [Pedobacter cryoconitis]|uniref:DNA-binding HxlR family transcriptional regulator n=1 Tax=Pedobacter cryoconitis TaxID=188932 RepID=A0A7W8ZRK0_9SPHI|nr:helix-turn-helix domain-containing protein [Pedobacter cryoconitis]MBB5638891.1 DNA-binding HxlR family transcriptional regulator [Pedobacter cryoconitis]MBB6270114.1 DNA-binding HxlR family transcriptional regulator [Pedobacter cryoconitis]